MARRAVEVDPRYFERDARMLREFVRHLLRQRGLELLKIPNSGDFLNDRHCDLVLDVGANIGQFGRGLRTVGYRGRIVSFEPLDSCYPQLKALADRDPTWDCRQVALGDHEYSTEINISRHTAYSSIRKLSAVGENFDPNTEVVATQKIDVSTIDVQMKSLQADHPFLKIDTQGFEKEVLAGAKDTLRKCVGLLLELPVENLYDNVWGFSEAVAYAESLGFLPAQILPVSPRRNDRVSALEFDCLFRRVD
jgi:FkbM family methyltransferase